MKTFLRAFWPACLFVVVIAVLAGTGYVAVTTNISTAGDWRTHAQANAQRPAGHPAKIRDTTVQALAAAKRQATATQRQHGIGLLRVPSQHIELTIFSTMTNTTLSLGVARYFPNRTMGDGNNVYAAHNLAAANLLLTRTAHLQHGAAITQTDFVHTYHYRVVYNRVVKATEVAVLKQTKEDRLTLIRCEGDVGTNFRRVIIARKTAVTPYVATPAAPHSFTQHLAPLVPVLLTPWFNLAVLLCFSGLLYLGSRRYRHLQEEHHENL